MEINPSEVTKILKEQIKNLAIRQKLQKLVKFYQLEMVLLGFMDWTMFRLVKW